MTTDAAAPTDVADGADPDTVLTVSADALAKVLELRAGEADADRLGLRIEITGTRGVDFTYDLAFELLDEVGDDVVVEHHDGLPLVVGEHDLDNLRGSVLDVPSNPGQTGLVLRNPNRPDLSGPAGPVELTGTVPEQITQLIETSINPAIAAHGGFAELVDVEGDVVKVRLGGGCQGCAMSRMTVAMGIEQAIQEQISADLKVEDVTDHATGENPYYANA